MNVDYVDHMGTDLSVVNAARVSFSKKSDWESDKNLSEKDANLIKYLAKHKHYSPFNHTFITLRVKAPIFVARQLQKHEYMPWNEISRRYVDFTPEIYEPIWRERPDESIKQGSGKRLLLNDDSFIDAMRSALRSYENLLKKNVAPEQARAVLPQSMLTEWIWSGTIRAWSKMFLLRTHSTSQEESKQIAFKAGKIIQDLFPVSWKELNDKNNQ